MAGKLITSIKQDIQSCANPQKAGHSQRFFKTGQGEYGEGDKFLGLSMPAQRVIAKRYAKTASLQEIETLLLSPYHEFRMVGLLIMTYQYPRLGETEQKKYYDFYIQHAQRVNNWDLVDVTAPKVVGAYLQVHKNDRQILKKLGRSKNLWERRIAVLSCYPMIKDGDFKDILWLSKVLLKDKEDLMHKAVGWMLREVGKKDEQALTIFLDKYTLQMPRTMLRYSIERFKESKRQRYLML
jgi:3-methyladenine DNA glycosylase AlkD